MTYIYSTFLVFLCIHLSDNDVLTAERKVCHERKFDALSAAIQFHHEGTVEIALTRGIGRKHYIEIGGNTEEFETMIWRYLSEVQESAFLLYAADAEHICAFLWRNETPGFRYQRVKSSREHLSGMGELLRARILAGSGQKSRGPQRRGLTPTQFPSTTADSRTTEQLIEELSNVVFPEQLRNELNSIQSLSIAPIKNLSVVPMALLRPFGDKRQVIDLFSVNFVTTVADLRDGATISRSNYRNPLIIGNPRPSEDPEWFFPNLSGAEQEADLAQSTFGGRHLSRERATLDAIVSSMRDADLIYIAAHAMSNPLGSLDESFIALARNRLTARQVQVEYLQSNPLVVLSACQTAQGKVLEAGIIGIARAFQIANAANTVMSLWNIDDDATYFQMRHFIVNLKRGITPAESMRRAMLVTRKNYPHPRYWAAFNVFGNHGVSASIGSLLR